MIQPTAMVEAIPFNVAVEQASRYFAVRYKTGYQLFLKRDTLQYTGRPHPV
jgi:hypothetical protein